MKTFRLWAMLIAVVALVGAGLWGWWNFELRWRPHTITKNQAEITKILESSGWVSPGLTGPKLYMVGFRACPDCIRFKTETFPALHEAGVDTRVIQIAQADENGVEKSSAPERATGAELWVNRRWKLLQDWEKAPAEAWTAPGVAPADDDVARSAVVAAGRKMVEDLTPLLRANGINFAYPTLIWWTKEGEMRGCACERAETYRFVRKELGVAG